MVCAGLKRALPPARLALATGLAAILVAPIGLQAAFEEPAPAELGHPLAPVDASGRSIEFGLGALRVHRAGVADFGLAPGGLRVLSADVVTGAYELTVDEPGEREAGPLSLDLAFAPEQVADDGAATMTPGSVRTRLGVLNVVVRDAQDRELTTRLAPQGDGLTIDVDDSGASYPLSVSVARVASFSKVTAGALGPGEMDFGSPGEIDPFEPAPVVSSLNACSYLDVSAGTNFTLALGTDHVVYAWGAGESGQLGETPIAQRSFPGPVPVLAGIDFISAGGSHGVALDSAGIVWTWGANGDGQLGIGNILNTATPSPVPGLPPIASISGGGMHTLAVGVDGSLWAWGENSSGQLGDGTNGQKTSPIAILPGGVATAAAGFEHSLVVMTDGSMLAFGRNDQGQLGDGVVAPLSLVPVTVAGPGGYVGASGGWKHSLAWKADGSAWSWGSNSNGQLGDGSFTPRNVPGAVGALPDNVVHMDAGSNHSLAIKADGTAHAWGANFSGQCGNGLLTASETNALPVPTISGAVRIAGGWEHSIVVRAGGRVDTWGRNVEGQLGIGVAAFNTFPAHVVDSDLDGFLAGVVQVSAGVNHSLAVKGDGTLWAWGDNLNGQLGDGTTTPRKYPVQIALPGGRKAIQAAAGRTHSLVLASVSGFPPGEVLAFGSDSDGQLGNGAGITSQLSPGLVYLTGVPPGGTVLTGIVQVEAGNALSVVRESSGEVRTFGDDNNGQLGDNGLTTDQHNPVKVVDTSGFAISGIVDIDAGDKHALAVQGGGTVYAWGLGSNGRLGNGATSGNFTRAIVPTGLGPGSNVVGVTAGDAHSAVWKNDGSAMAFGANSVGQLGDNTTVQKTTAVAVLGIVNIEEMDAGSNFTVARIGSLPPSAPNMRAWGSNSSGRLGDGSFQQRELPVVVRDLTLVTQVSAGGSHSLGRRSNGEVWGAGDATLHALGINYNPGVPDPKKVEFGPHCLNAPPACSAGADILASCDGPTLSGSGVDPEGEQVSYAWTTTCAGVTFTPNASVASPQVHFGIDCGVNCTFTLTVTDPGGAQCTDTVNVIVNDGLAPSGAMGSIEACYQSLGEAELAAKDATDWVDNCAVGAEYVSSNATSCTVQISVQAEDFCGNLSTAIVYTTTVDSTAPVLSGVPATTSAECGDVPPPPSVTATDDCAGSVAVTFEETESGTLCGGSGPGQITRTWSATDACGNLASASQIITLVDTTDPQLVGVPDHAIIECGEPWPTPPTVTATDSCATVLEVGLLESAGNAGCAGTELVRTWTVYDDCGNFATQSQTISVVDSTPPVLVGVPADVSVSCATIPAMATVTATDACDPAVIVTSAEVRTDGDCPDRYTLTRTWYATDFCGNPVSDSQVITVTDDVAPVLAGVPGPITVECDAIPAAASPTATDDCDPAPGITMTPVITPGGCPQSYTLTRTWTALDRCGNSSSQSQIITVVDTTAPVLAGVPGPMMANCDAVPAAATVTASDNCGTPAVTLAETITPGACPQSYVLRRTWTATDPCGNSSSGFQDITVVDLVAPTFSGVPMNATVECSAVPSPAPVTSSDNCDASPTLTLAESTVAGACPQSYQLTRTWTSVDDCGNSNSVSQVLTVVDTTAPTITGVPANQTVQCNSVPPPASPTAADNCDGTPTLTYTQTTGTGPCTSSYSLTRTWTATDDCGNTFSKSQVLTVVDTIAPVVTPQNTDLYCLYPANHQYELFTRSQFSPIITDNCNASPSWRFLSCASNQPDDIPGGNDGNTVNDCLVDPNGEWMKVRAERDNKKAGGRRYTIMIVANDGCGNNSAPAQMGYIYVPLKNPAGTCLSPNDGM